MDFKVLTDDALAGMFADERFKTAPKRHQLITLAWGFDRHRVSLWHGIGTGKSLAALYLHQLWSTRKHLIVCPNSVVGGWADQIAQHTYLHPVLLRGSKAERRARLFEGGPGVYVVNYEGLLVLFCERPDGRARPDPGLVAQAGVDGVTADECHALANPTAIQTKVFRELSRRAEHAIIMTGTPISTSEADLWSEYHCLDGGVSLGTNRWAFLNKHFRQDFWGGWKVKDGEREAILARVAPRTLRFSRQECVDLPPRSYQVRSVPMSAEQRRLYRQIVDEQRITLGGLEADVPSGQSAQKLSQVAGGFVFVGDEAVVLADQPKIDEVRRTLDELGDEKVVIFHAYVEEGRLLEAMLQKRGTPYAALRGEVADKDDQVRRFQADDRCRVLVAHPKSGGVGLNLQVATVAGFYSNGLYGAVARAQAEGRIYRTGQDRPCLFIDWELEGSLDQRHLHRIEDQAELIRSALDFVRNWRG